MAYAAGAGAAAAALAGAHSADAAVVANTTGIPFGVGSTTDIDFNGDGTADFKIGHERQTAGDTNTDRVLLKENASHNDGYVVDFGNNPFPSALTAGTTIGPDSTFNAQFNNNVANQIADDDKNDDGIPDDPRVTNFPVDNVVGNTRYAGVRFRIDPAGPDLYGWIGIDITNADDLTGTITGFGFEDTGEAIQAGQVPEPAGLGLLALGAVGLLRRKRA
jgi:hypothetical protein